MTSKTAEYINILGEFCGKKDITEINKTELLKNYSLEKADIMVLFGGSILEGGDVFAKAIINNAAKKYIIVGGEGHTTNTLRNKISAELPCIDAQMKTEAELFSAYIKYKYGLTADYLENKSTNCGNNIVNLLNLIKKKKLNVKSMILIQDRTMQRRMDAVAKKYVPDDTLIINYPAYEINVILKNQKGQFNKELHGMWDMERYISLLMGEIPRLCDNEHGYGPNGKGFIAHVDVPDEVLMAFLELKKVYPNFVREANPDYASI